jgi:hypothetical protein
MPLGGFEKCLRGELQALQLPEFGVLAFDVHGHVRVDLLQRGQEPPPQRDVVAASDGDEVPRGVLRPGAQCVAAAERDRLRVVGVHPAMLVVQPAVDLGGLVDPGVLGGGVVDQPVQRLDRGDGDDALPERVAEVHLGADVGGVDLGRQSQHSATGCTAYRSSPQLPNPRQTAEPQSTSSTRQPRRS